MMRLFYLSSMILISLNTFRQTKRFIKGEKYYKTELEKYLADTVSNYPTGTKTEIIGDKEIAITIAEKILFNIYGQKNIEFQRPYEVFKIKKYWIIGGTLPNDWLGGTFLMIMDAQNGRVIKINHGE